MMAGCSSQLAVQMQQELPDLSQPAVVPQPDLAGYTPVCDPLAARSSAPEVGVLPDDGETPQVSVLGKAQHDIRMMIYEMGYGGIFDTIKAKAAAGVQVRVMLDEGTTSNQKYYDALTAAGVDVRWSDPKFPYMHAKFFVVDGEEAVLSTGNYSYTYSIVRERNFTAHLTDAQDVADLVALFDADWDKKDPDLSCTRLVVSPINSRARILGLLKSAQKTLDIESMQFADTDVRSAVSARAQAGVKVRVMLADPSWIDANAGAATYLKNFGVPVKYMSKPGVHVKAFVVDGTTAYVGSENFSYTSLSSNREVGIFTNDPSSVKPVADTFEKDFAAGVSF
jgi:phosphatidylserine/phosphatidylglycerophosphate/cardiolipin synthase-like enzyme